MADPFSILAGAAGLADVCIRLTNFIKQAKDGFHKVDEDLEALSNELTTLSSVSDLIKRSFKADPAGTLDPGDQQIIDSHWQTTRTTLTSCQELIERLNTLVIQVLGNGNPRHAKLNSLRKYLRQQAKEEQFIELRQRLNTHQIALQTSVAAVNVYVVSMVYLGSAQLTHS